MFSYTYIEYGHFQQNHYKGLCRSGFYGIFLSTGGWKSYGHGIGVACFGTVAQRGVKGFHDVSAVEANLVAAQSASQQCDSGYDPAMFRK